MLSITVTPRLAAMCVQRLPVSQAAARGGERAADRDVAETQPRLQLAGEVLDLEVGPDPDDARPHRRRHQREERRLREEDVSHLTLPCAGTGARS